MSETTLRDSTIGYAATTRGLYHRTIGSPKRSGQRVYHEDCEALHLLFVSRLVDESDHARRTMTH